MNMLQAYFPENVEWVTVCDILPDRLEKAYQAFGFVHRTDCWTKAVQENTPDIVIVATPAYYHCDIAMFAMRCGCHVLTEKPLDLSLSKCLALEESQKQTGKVVGVGMQYRNMPHYRSLKHAGDQGRSVTIDEIMKLRPTIAECLTAEEA